MTGVLIPVFSLRSSDSVGTGEFLDLLEFGTWCKSAGLQVIQLLPVNDTGDDPSPYSALSAFALHPLFIRIQELPEFKTLTSSAGPAKKLKALQKEHQDELRLQYRDVLYGKLEILRDLFSRNAEAILEDKGYLSWVKANPWVEEYAVFRSLKQLNDGHGWPAWKNNQHLSAKEIKALWKAAELPVHFYGWIQYRLEQQFIQVAEGLRGMGILLKGDIPILMNEDSVDVWAHRDIFQFHLRAGAPPDGFSPEGQNWGFPVYNWEELEKTNYDWWRKRLLQADKFYQAYRIDHVLGFFRIWTIPYKNTSGILGYFQPSSFIHRADLYRKGFDDGRIKWLSEPHIPGHDLRARFGIHADEIIRLVFSQLGTEDLFLFRDDLEGEREIHSLNLNWDDKKTLLAWYRDRTFLPVEEHEFAPTWNFRDCTRFQQLSDHERAGIEELVREKGHENEGLLATQGRKLLGFMLDTVGMLTCAEDLGAIPQGVPPVLQDLGVLSLKIPRWSRKWDEPGQPYIPVQEYPFLSVCAPSVHDTSTLRDWWEHEEGKEGFWHVLGFQDHCPGDYHPDIARRVLEQVQTAGSGLCIYQLQDFFALVPELRAADSKDERVNVPGTVGETNWSYRIPLTIDALAKQKKLVEMMKELSALRN